MVRIVPAPSLKIKPRSQTLYKGDSLMIRCLTTNNNNGLSGGKGVNGPAVRLGYTWTKNERLLQARPGEEYWEDLYPDGSLLVVKNIRRSATYKCVVSNSVAPVSQAVYVNVISGSPNQTNICPREQRQGIEWPESAPGPKVFAECQPSHGEGYVERVCEQQDFGRARWLPPDFSNCVSQEWREVQKRFVQMTHGYQEINATHVLSLVLQYARNGDGLFAGQVRDTSALIRG